MVVSNAPNFDGRQNPKVLTDRIMFHAFGHFIQIFELASATACTGTFTVNSTADSPDPYLKAWGCLEVVVPSLAAQRTGSIHPHFPAPELPSVVGPSFNPFNLAVRSSKSSAR